MNHYFLDETDENIVMNKYCAGNPCNVYVQRNKVRLQGQYARLGEYMINLTGKELILYNSNLTKILSTYNFADNEMVTGRMEVDLQLFIDYSTDTIML